MSEFLKDAGRLLVSTGVKRSFHFLLLAGWLVPTATALLFFGRWIREIVVPTLKGGNFDQLYDLHQVRYLDVTLVSTLIAFAWVATAALRWARNEAARN